MMSVKQTTAGDALGDRMKSYEARGTGRRFLGCEELRRRPLAMALGIAALDGTVNVAKFLAPILGAVAMVAALMYAGVLILAAGSGSKEAQAILQNMLLLSLLVVMGLAVIGASLMAACIIVSPLLAADWIIQRAGREPHPILKKVGLAPGRACVLLWACSGNVLDFLLDFIRLNDETSQ